MRSLLHALAALTVATPALAGPNVLIVIVDDAGYTDFGAYGGDTHTPTIDALAARGTKLSRFYTSPQCGPTRAMLMTGADNHAVGIGTINEAMSDELRGLPAYAMKLDPATHTLGERLQDAGYFTIATGKWGIGKSESSLPGAHGFIRSHVLDASGADNWEQKPYMPLYDTAPWFEDGEPVTLPENFYSSRYIADRTIDLLDEVPPDTPFLAVVGFQAIHLPVQAPRTYTDHYDGRFDAGWDTMRRERVARVRDLGLVSGDVLPAASPDDARPWATLDDEERALATRHMQVNAGMLESMDHELGRVLDHLASQGKLDETVIVVMSDNGPESNPMPAEHHPIAARTQAPLMERLGERGTTASIGMEWATVSAAPFSLFKFYTSEGGLRVPLVIAGPGVPARPVVHARAHVTDVLPTVLDLAGVPITPNPASAPPLYGRSLKPALLGEVDEVYGPDDATGVEVAGNAALFRGAHKLVKLAPPFGDHQWRLYDIVADPGETRDLAADEPDLFASMRADYERYAEDVGVAELGPDYSPVTQIYRNNIMAGLQRYGWMLGLGLCGILVLLGGVAWVWRRRREDESGNA